MADTKLSALGALTGADSASGDLFYVDDISATTSKSITRAELAIAMNATQAEQEAATATNKLASPAVQQYHPSASKAWGLITPATTVTASYPSAGVSVVKNATGDFTVTHGVTFSSTSYAVLVSPSINQRISVNEIIRTTTTVRITMVDAAGSALDPTNFNYVCFGDLA